MVQYSLGITSRQFGGVSGLCLEQTVDMITKMWHLNAFSYFALKVKWDKDCISFVERQKGLTTIHLHTHNYYTVRSFCLQADNVHCRKINSKLLQYYTKLQFQTLLVTLFHYPNNWLVSTYTKYTDVLDILKNHMIGRYHRTQLLFWISNGKYLLVIISNNIRNRS